MNRSCLFCGCLLLDYPKNNSISLRQRICHQCWSSTLNLSAEELALELKKRNLDKAFNLAHGEQDIADSYSKPLI